MNGYSTLLGTLWLAACGGAGEPMDTAPPDSGATDTADTGAQDTGTQETGTQETGTQETGTNLEPAIPTALSDATPGWFGQLAYSPTTGAWLMATQSAGIVGRMMSDDGTPRTDGFTISPAGQADGWAPSVVYGPGTFLVVWVDYTAGWQAWGRFVAEAGTMSGDAFALPLDEPVPNLGGDRTSALAWDTHNERFVYVWNGAHLAPIGLDGTLGTVVDLAEPSPDDHWGAAVAVNPDANEYCVAYDRRNRGDFGLTPVDAATLQAGVGSTIAIASTNVLIVYNAVERRYLVVYDTGYVTGVKALLLGSCNLGDVVGAFDIWPGIATASAAWNPVSNQYAVIAQNANDDGNTWVVFDSTGAILADGDPFLGDSEGNFAPEIAPNTATGAFAAISSREYSQTRFVANLGFRVAE